MRRSQDDYDFFLLSTPTVVNTVFCFENDTFGNDIFGVFAVTTTWYYVGKNKKWNRKNQFPGNKSEENDWALHRYRLLFTHVYDEDLMHEAISLWFIWLCRISKTRVRRTLWIILDFHFFYPVIPTSRENPKDHWLSSIFNKSTQGRSAGLLVGGV